MISTASLSAMKLLKEHISGLGNSIKVKTVGIVLVAENILGFRD